MAKTIPNQTCTSNLTSNLTSKKTMQKLQAVGVISKVKNMTIQQFIQANQLKQADVLVLRKKFFGMVDHFAVFLGYHADTFHPLFAANYTKGTQIVDQQELTNFLNILIPERIERFTGTDSARQQAVNRAISKIGSNDYDYFNNNCEHYKNFVQTGVPRSEQAETFGKSVAVIAVIALFGALLDR